MTDHAQEEIRAILLKYFYQGSPSKLSPSHLDDLMNEIADAIRKAEKRGGENIRTEILNMIDQWTIGNDTSWDADIEIRHVAKAIKELE